MNALTDMQQALAATRAADLRREACLVRLARAARGTARTTWGGRTRNVALAVQQRLRHLVPAGPATAAPLACCA